MPKCPSCGTKAIFLILCCICFLFVGCEKNSADQWEPQRASAEIEPYAKQAIKIIDQYLNFEIDSSDAWSEFIDLAKRISSFDIAYENGYNNADRAIDNAISHLYSPSPDKISDVEFRLYRDILSFQVGEDVSKKSYEARKKEYFELETDRQIIEDLGAMDFPFDSVFLHEYDGNIDISFYFDEINGIYLTDIEQFIESIISSVESCDSTITSVSFGYAIYGQDVLTFSLNLDQSYFNPSERYILYSEDNGNLNTLSRSANVSEIISAANAYLGEYAS